MYSLVRLMSPGRLLREQVPALAISFVIAELFYKFHSFTLETLAFLAPWVSSTPRSRLDYTCYAVLGQRDLLR